MCKMSSTQLLTVRLESTIIRCSTSFYQVPIPPHNYFVVFPPWFL